MNGFLQKIVDHLNRSSGIAANFDDREYSYSELRDLVEWRIGALQGFSRQSIGIIADSCIETYASILACWLTGNAYVPIPRNYPLQRVSDIIDAAEITHVFCEGDIPNSINSLNLNKLTISENSTSIEFNDIPSEYIAYILFTSGTTGKPKGVPISHGNLQAFYEGFLDLKYDLDSTDRFLQMFELTFDLSVMSFMVPLTLGASFYPLKQNLIKPLALYDALENHSITFALMVPSAVTMLEPYAEDIDLQNLKYTQFCGEALKSDTVKLWNNCASSSQIDNVYGPTEATIYCTRYTCNLDTLKHHQGIVSIGKPMKHVSLSILEEELCLGGLQTTSGYVKATESQKERFYNSNHIIFYKSGDKASYDGEDYFCHGRLDDQVKVQGYRVELSELEYAVSQHFEGIKSIAVSFTAPEGTQLGLFIKQVDTMPSIELILKQLHGYLPFYMIPRVIRIIEEFPLNANGKIDRKELSSWLSLK